jgi:hypothetical protein
MGSDNVPKFSSLILRLHDASVLSFIFPGSINFGEVNEDWGTGHVGFAG